MESLEKFNNFVSKETAGIVYLKPGETPPNNERIMSGPMGGKYYISIKKPQTSEPEKTKEIKPDESSIEDEKKKISEEDEVNLPNVQERYDKLSSFSNTEDSEFKESRAKVRLLKVAKYLPLEHMQKIGKIDFVGVDYLVDIEDRFSEKPMKHVTGQCANGRYITIGKKGDYKTIIHEIGHTIHKTQYGQRFPSELQTKMNSIWRECKDTGKGFVSEYSKKNIGEFFAESYTVYMINKDNLAKRNPKMFALMEEVDKNLKAEYEKNKKWREANA